MFNETDFPALLGAELYRPHPDYVAKAITRAQVVHDFNAQPGSVVQLDKYSFWDNDTSLTLESRARGATQVLGTANQRSIPKKKITLELEEFTGPAALGDPDAPGVLTIPEQTLQKAQRILYDTRNARAFHQSIGSLTLLNDFSKWEDRVYLSKLLESPNTYNPGEVPDGGTYGTGPARFSVKRDLLTVVERLHTRQTPTFEDGTYACLCSPRFLKHLRQDPDFREVARYPGSISAEMMISGGMGPMQIPFVNSPNSLIFGGGLQGQAHSVNQMPTMMPGGIVFEGVRFFSTNNMPTGLVDLNYTGLNPGADPIRHPIGMAQRKAHFGLFFGPGAIGMGVAGIGPEVRLNANDDFGRFYQVIWRTLGAWTLLHPEFVEIARTYDD
jgi:hypothetical protein